MIDLINTGSEFLIIKIIEKCLCIHFNIILRTDVFLLRQITFNNGHLLTFYFIILYNFKADFLIYGE